MKKTMKYEEAIAQLEAAVARLESGALGLDEAIAVYEEAVKLVRICNERLEAAEQRVKLLTEGEDGSISDRPFDDIDED